MHACSKGQTVLVPGKIVLAGEYAVLDKAPAIVMAIDHGVGCRVTNGHGIHTPTGDTRFVQTALLTPAQSMHYDFFTWNPVEEFGPNKPGFGGSAAACVASCVAAGRNPEDAFHIHHEVQGSGSGIDVAASIHGGLLRFQEGKTKTLPPLVTPIIIWSGQSAQTGPRVQQYLSWSNRRSFVQESQMLVDAFVDDPIRVFSQLYRLLSYMEQEAKVPYLTESITNIISIAEDYGGAAKPSGAGGGDCVVALFSDDAQRAASQKNCPSPSLIAKPSTRIQIPAKTNT